MVRLPVFPCPRIPKTERVSAALQAIVSMSSALLKPDIPCRERYSLYVPIEKTSITPFQEFQEPLYEQRRYSDKPFSNRRRECGMLAPYLRHASKVSQGRCLHIVCRYEIGLHLHEMPRRPPGE